MTETTKAPLSKGFCNPGYVDKTKGRINWWACGAKCKGGKYFTDGVCNCACIKNPQHIEDNTTILNENYIIEGDGSQWCKHCGKEIFVSEGIFT